MKLKKMNQNRKFIMKGTLLYCACTMYMYIILHSNNGSLLRGYTYTCMKSVRLPVAATQPPFLEVDTTFTPC